MAVEASSFRALAIRGGIGLMNTRTGGGLTAENAYTTIGGGPGWWVVPVPKWLCLPMEYTEGKRREISTAAARFGAFRRLNSGIGY